jgi:ubiquinone/menaquinone biosynthesis C-methylase UbiE
LNRDIANDDDRRAYWGRQGKNYDLAMAVLGGPVPRMADLAGSAVKGLPRVLEIGAGTGLVTPALARNALDVIATDYSSEMVALLELRVRKARLTNVRCERADLHELRFGASSFDAVVAANVLHLVRDLPEAIAALRPVLKPAGDSSHRRTATARRGSHEAFRVSWQSRAAATGLIGDHFQRTSGEPSAIARDSGVTNR